MKVLDIIKKYDNDENNLINILTDIQSNSLENYITEKDIKEVSEALNISQSKIISTISFYTALSLKPRGKYIIQVCNTITCHISGSLDVLEALKEELGIELGQTSKDGLFTLETSSCLGACNVSPSMRINGEVYGYLSPMKIKFILQEIKEKEGLL